MLLENGWLVDARHVPSPHHDCRPEDEKPTLLVVHNISLPPGEFGGPWIDALFTGTIDPNAHPFFAEIAHLRVSAHCLIRRDGEVVQYVPFDKRPGMPGYRCITGANGATISRLGSSWKVRTLPPTPMPSISSWLLLPTRLSDSTRQSPTILPGTAISLRREKPIPARHLTGRGFAPCLPRRQNKEIP